MVQLPIYLDNHATTRTDPRVLEAMLPYFTERYGNAASRQHVFGWQAEDAVETARGQIAELIGADGREIIFTSGATESNNLALKGVAGIHGQQGNHIVTVTTEHRATLDPCKRLEREGFQVTYLPVDREGLISVDQVAAAIRDKTILISVMAANNEIGVLQPIAALGRLCKDRGVLLHTDAVQAVGKIPIDVAEMGIDLLSLSAHKFYGPKGIGALYVRRHGPHVRLEPMMDGGGHERGMRSGTLPVPLIVGLGTACELCRREMTHEAKRSLALRERLHRIIADKLEGVVLNGHPTLRLPGNLNMSFADVQSDALMVAMKTVAVSSGSACTSASVQPSHVLKALGISDDLAHGSIRFGIGRFNTEEEIDYAANEVIRLVKHLRNLSPSYVLEQAGALGPLKPAP